MEDAAPGTEVMWCALKVASSGVSMPDLGTGVLGGGVPCGEFPPELLPPPTDTAEATD